MKDGLGLLLALALLIGAVIYGMFIRQEPGLYDEGGTCYGFSEYECNKYLDAREVVGSPDRSY